MKIIRLGPSGKEVECDDNESVLSALEKAGYALPNNCRAGACGECKIKVTNGEFDQGLILPMALSNSEREEGYGLMCMARVKSDVLEIEWGTEDAQPKLFPPKENRRYVVTEKTLVTPRIVKLKMRGLGEAMRFWPGQYITLGNPEKNIPERCYSIASIPGQDDEITLFVTKLDEGVTSTWIHNELEEGERVKINGPYGTFIGDPSVETPVLCLAAGSGLAPIQSLASAALLRGGFKNRATILFSAKRKEDLFETGYFKFLKTKFRNFQYRYTLTQEENPGGLTGRIPDILPELYPDLSKTSLYISGTPGFVKSCIEVAKTLGAKDELIHSEGFIGQAIPQTPDDKQLLS